MRSCRALRAGLAKRKASLHLEEEKPAPPPLSSRHATSSSATNTPPRLHLDSYDSVTPEVNLAARAEKIFDDKCTTPRRPPSRLAFD